MNVGVIGLGTMGGPMVSALLAAGHDLTVYDVSADALTRATETGATAATSCAAVARAVSVVLLSLPAPAHVARVVTGSDGLLAVPAPGLVIVDTSTVDPDSTRAMAARAAESGAGYLDAPILGRPDMCGIWTFPVGGEPDVLERARPVLEVLGSSVRHVGRTGSGNAIKLLNNLMFGVINAISAEVMVACERVGVSPEVFYDTVAESGAATVSPLFRFVGRKVLDGDFDPAFTIDLMDKDVSLALAMLRAAKLSPIVGSAAQVVNGLARGAGYGGQDSSAVARVYQALLDSDAP